MRGEAYPNRKGEEVKDNATKPNRNWQSRITMSIWVAYPVRLAVGSCTAEKGVICECVKKDAASSWGAYQPRRH